jgi:hypothetical protein
MDQLDTAQIILLLVSADFMPSEFCYSIEMTQAVTKHDTNRARVIPVILRPTDWQGAPFAKLEVLPADGKPVTEWRTHDAGWQNVVNGIRRAIQDLQVNTLTNPSSASREQQIPPYMIDIVKATKFVFDEVEKWLDDVHQYSTKPLPEPTRDNAAPQLTPQDFATLEANPPELESAINVQLAKTDAYEIRGLVNQIQIHRRNLIDFKTTEAEYGPLAPQFVKRGVEREADAIVEKSARLKGLLEQVYGRSIENA